MYINIIFGRKGNEKNKKKPEKNKNKPNLFNFSFRSQINFIKKYNIIREEKDIDINLRFILGKCNISTRDF